jgi:hypothetical protein
MMRLNGNGKMGEENRCRAYVFMIHRIVSAQSNHVKRIRAPGLNGKRTIEDTTKISPTRPI